MWRWIGRLVDGIGVHVLSDVEQLPDPEAVENERTIRRTLLTTYLCLIPVTFGWGVAYVTLGEYLAGAVPGTYAVLTAIALLALRRFGGWEWLRRMQMVCHLLLPFLLMWALGGFGPSSAVLVWAFLAPIGSLWAHRLREGVFVSLGFVALTIFSAIIDSSLPDTPNIPGWMVTVFYAGNFIAIIGIVFALTAYFVGDHRNTVAVMRRNRELESAYLQQEISLRQNERLATVGRLSAGLAHELNNPAAAVQQASQELSRLLLGSDRVDAEIAQLGLSADESPIMREYAGRIQERIERPEFLDPVARSDREADVEHQLETAGLDDAWEVAPALVDLGLDADDVRALAGAIVPAHRPAAFGLLARQFQHQGLLNSLDSSTGRIISLVRALKSYTHLDQAPRRRIDVHEGLDSTLVMLQNKLKTGVEVQREFDPDLPEIDAFPRELNQVWTNILDNALDAMGGRGVIRITTRRDAGHVIVDIQDDGPGIPQQLVSDVFDPFVTSKAPGEGTGLGLNISHRIVTERHHGEISVDSAPGRTVFRVTLPIEAHGEDPHADADEVG